MIFPNSSESICKSFRPLTGISLFLFRAWMHHTSEHKFSSPHGDFSFSICGFIQKRAVPKFSSPHGDFSFSIKDLLRRYKKRKKVFVPSRGFLFFYIVTWNAPIVEDGRFRPLTGISLFLSGSSCFTNSSQSVFVPSRGFLFFYEDMKWSDLKSMVFVPSRGFLFFYRSFLKAKGRFYTVFVPSRGFLFFYFPSI